MQIKRIEGLDKGKISDFYLLRSLYAHKNTAFFVFVCLYAFLCLIKLIRLYMCTSETCEVSTFFMFLQCVCVCEIFL